jgi:hypothetical protein
MPTAQAQGLAALSVCKVLEDMDALSGKLIAVSGTLNISRHGASILDPSCPGTFQRGGHSWPVAVDFRASYSAAAIPPEHAGSADARSVQFVRALAGHVISVYFLSYPPSQPPFRIAATFVGVLHTRTIEEIESHGPAGFGAGQGLPAQLQIIAVRDLALLQSDGIGEP